MALPADISPPPAPGEPGHPGNADRPTSPGLPRLFFADEPDQEQEQEQEQQQQPQQQFAGRPYGQPTGPGQQAGPGQPGPGQPGPGQPVGLGQAGPGQPADAGGPPPRSTRPRPTRPPDRELRQRAIASLVLGVLSLAALLGLEGDLHRGVYLLVFSAVIGIGACVIGITAVLKARRTGSYRPRGAVGGIVFGTLAALLSVPLLVFYLTFPHQVNNYLRCVNQAQNSGAQRACMDRFYRSIHLGSAALGGGAFRLSRAPAGPIQGSADGPPGRLPGGGASPSSAHLSR